MLMYMFLHDEAPNGWFWIALFTMGFCVITVPIMGFMAISARRGSTGGWDWYTESLTESTTEKAEELINGQTFEDLRKDMVTMILGLEAQREKLSVIDGAPYKPLF